MAKKRIGETRGVSSHRIRKRGDGSMELRKGKGVTETRGVGARNRSHRPNISTITRAVRLGDGPRKVRRIVIRNFLGFAFRRRGPIN